MDITLRKFSAQDVTQVVNLFRDTVRHVNRKDYTEAQVRAWAPDVIYEDRWCEKLLSHYTVVAECNGIIFGFGDIHDNGYFDHLFVHKDFQGMGVASQIVKAIEVQALTQGNEVITVAVSITAKPFFLSKGYVIVKKQLVEFNGQQFTNYCMEKTIEY